MMINLPGDPVRGETSQTRAAQPERGPNPGVFASVLSALSGGRKAPAEELEEKTPPLASEGSVSPNEPDVPTPDTAAHSEAHDHPSTDSPETRGLLSDNAARLGVSSGKHFMDPEEGIEPITAPVTDVSVPDLAAPGHQEKRSEGALPSRKPHLPGGSAMATDQTRNSSVGAGRTIQPEFSDASNVHGLEDEVAGPVSASPSQAGQKPSDSAMSPVPPIGPEGAPTAANDRAAGSTHSIPAHGSSSPTQAADPAAYKATAPEAEAVSYARSLVEMRATQIGVATLRNRMNDSTVHPPHLARGDERGDGQTVPQSAARVATAPDSPLIDAVRAPKQHGQVTLFSGAVHRTEGPTPPTPALTESIPAPTPRTVAGTSQNWNGAMPKPGMAPADLFARSAQRGDVQAAGAWLAPADEGAFPAMSSGSLAHQSASAPLPDLVTLQPRAPAEPARDVARQIGAQILNLGKGRFEMSLSPAELGRVEMWLQDTDNRLTLTINAERPETLDLIRRHIGLLEQEMRQLGYGSLSLQLGADGSPGSHTAHKPADTLNQHEGTGAAPEGEIGMRPPVPSADHLDIRL